MVKNQRCIWKVTQEFVKVLVSLCCSSLPVTVSHRERSVEWGMLYAGYVYSRKVRKWVNRECVGTELWEYGMKWFYFEL